MGHTCFIVKLGFHVMNCVGRLNIETYSLAIEGLDKNLHCVVSTTRTIPADTAPHDTHMHARKQSNKAVV